MRYIHIMEYYLAMKGSEVLIHATTWLNLENITLSEISQHKGTNTVWFYLYEVHRLAKFTDTESKNVVAWGWGNGGMRSYYLMALGSVSEYPLYCQNADTNLHAWGISLTLGVPAGSSAISHCLRLHLSLQLEWGQVVWAPHIKHSRPIVRRQRGLLSLAGVTVRGELKFRGQ